jgi:hypothetical protein
MPKRVVQQRLHSDAHEPSALCFYDIGGRAARDPGLCALVYYWQQ